VRFTHPRFLPVQRVDERFGPHGRRQKLLDRLSRRQGYQRHGRGGDPLDILVLGQAVERGEVIPVRLLGILKMLDDGEEES